jgi:methylmalonyl-CoA mutase N-terminal domain/subunit
MNRGLPVKKIDKIEEGFLAKPTRTTTWSDLHLKESYTPEDVKDMSYDQNICDPGQYPYTRGIFSKMYRGKLWTQRQQMGWGLPENMNEQFKILIKQGATGLAWYRDLPTTLGLDPDHPLAHGSVGRVGVTFCCLEDMEKAMADLPLDEISITLINASTTNVAILAAYVAAAEHRGVDLSKLRGTLTNDPIFSYFCHSKEVNPLDFALKMVGDVIEFCSEKMPLWSTMYISCFYNLRESGELTAPQEVAWGFAVAMEFIRAAISRGTDIDSFAPRASAFCQAGVDLFEEAAKFRAMRRMWAKMMKEKFNAKDRRSLQLKIAAQSTGSQLVGAQPLNNVIRVAYQLLGAVLGGAQSITCDTYLEPFCVPTPESSRLALGTHQILAHETSVPAVADPLGGSYYIETLTDTIEKEAEKILNKIEGMGGFVEAIKKGYIQDELDRGVVKFQKQVENRKRVVVGLNEFVSSKEEKEEILPGGLSEIPQKDIEKEAIRRVKHLRRSRNTSLTKNALNHLSDKAKEGANLLPPAIDAVKASATLEEIMNTVRNALGYSRDPFNMRNNAAPFD